MTTPTTCKCGHVSWDHNTDKEPLQGWPCTDIDCDCADYEVGESAPDPFAGIVDVETNDGWDA